jgi:uncharacterized membrane protein YdfJ with MMPL/SSD domain
VSAPAPSSPGTVRVNDARTTARWLGLVVVPIVVVVVLAVWLLRPESLSLEVVAAAVIGCLVAVGIGVLRGPAPGDP